MPKFGQIWFNGGYFGGKPIAPGFFPICVGRIAIGRKIRKQLGKRIIFRHRKGNDQAGSKKGQEYQDKYVYVVPTSINNTQGLAARVALKEAVYNWKNVLTDEQKAVWNERAKAKGRVWGYNLYYGDYVKARVIEWTRFGKAKFGMTAKFGPPAL